MNLDVQATGGVVETVDPSSAVKSQAGELPKANQADQICISGKTLPGAWRNGNWYDLNLLCVDRVTYSKSEFNAFTQSVAADQGSRWETGTPGEAVKAGIGATIAPENRISP